MPRLRPRAFPALFPFLLACGRLAAEPVGAPPTADAGSPDSGSPDSGPCTLAVTGPAQQVSDPSSYAGLTSAAAGEGNVLMGWVEEPTEEDGGTAPEIFRVRSVGFDGTPSAPSVEVLSGEGFVAQAFGQAGAFGGEAPCSLVPLESDGTAAGAAVNLSTATCLLGRATATGFDAVADTLTSLSLIRTDPGGDTVSTASLAVTYGPVAGWATFSDGSFLLASQQGVYSDGCPCSEPVYAQHFSAGGQPLAPQVQVGISVPVRPVLVPVGAGVLFAGASVGEGPTLQPLTVDGETTGAPVSLSGVGAGGFFLNGGVDIAPLGAQEAVVVWRVETSEDAQEEGEVLAEVVSAAGVPLAPPFVVAARGAVGETVRVVPTPGGALVAWEARSGSTGSSVTAAPLGCP